MIDDLYAVLGAKKSDTAPNLAFAYRQMVKKHHPDKGGDPDKFRDLVFAWNVLRDPEKRRRYDETGQYDFQFPRVTQQTLIKMLSDSIEAILKKLDEENTPIEFLDITATLRLNAKDVVGALKSDLAIAEKRVHSINHLLKSIVRKGEEENLFSTMLAPKLVDAQDKREKIATQLHLARRFLEEVEMYETPIEMMRAMQAGMYPVYGETHMSTNLDTYAPPGMFGFKF